MDSREPPLKRRVTTKPPKEMPELSQRAQREQRIRLLKQSLPRQTELAIIFATDPEEADKLAAYCRQVVTRIEELEEDHKAELKREEAERHGKVRERAKQRSEAKRAATVQGWLNKEFSAEDRATELSETRSRHRSEKRDRFTEQVKQRRSVREDTELEKHKEVLQSVRAWELNVEQIEQKQKESRRKWQYENHGRNLAFEKVQANLQQQERDRLNRMREDAGDIEFDIELHSWRARQVVEEKRRIAHSTNIKTVPKETVDRENDKKRWDQLRQKEDRHLKNLMAVAEEKGKEQEERQAKQKALADRALRRVEEKEREEKKKIKKLAEKIRARDEHLEAKQQERLQQSKHTAGARLEKVKCTRDISVTQLKMRNAELAQKWADRAIRIGEIGGVPAEKRPDLIRNHADALESSLRRGRELSEKGEQPDKAATPSPHIAVVVKASPEHPAWLSLLVPRSAKKKETTKKKPGKTPEAEPSKEKQNAVLRMQSLRRQQDALQHVGERRAMCFSARERQEAAVRLQGSMRRKQAQDDVADRRSRSSSPIGRSRGGAGQSANGSRTSKEDQEDAVRLIQSGQRNRNARETTEVRRAQSPERKGAQSRSASPTSPTAAADRASSPKEDAARLMQSSGRSRAARDEVETKRASSREFKKSQRGSS